MAYKRLHMLNGTIWWILTSVYTCEVITTILGEFLMTISKPFISLWLISHFPLDLACSWLPHQVGRRGGSAFSLFTPFLSSLHLHFCVMATEIVHGYSVCLYWGSVFTRLQVGSIRTISVLFSALSSSPHPHSPQQKGGAQWRVKGWMNDPIARIDIWYCWTRIESKGNWIVLKHSELFLPSAEGNQREAELL